MQNFQRIAALAAVVVSISACVGNPPPVMSPALPLVTAPPSVRMPSYTGGDVIASQDVLDISVFKVPELSKTTRVDDFGNITLPLVGVIPVGGKSAIQVERLIAQRLQTQYMHNPQVSVSVKEATRNRFTVEGEVTKPGVFPMSGQMTFLQAMATAGGTTRLADTRRAFLYRNGARYSVNLEAIRLGYAADPMIMADDRIVFITSNEKVFADTVQSTLPVLPMLRY